MLAVLTGDIINSRKITSNAQWLGVLKEALEADTDWEIFRGDSFQLSSPPADALMKAIYIKACMKTLKGIDVRIAIGIGKKDYSAESISESNGEAFIYSGEKFETLKKEKLSLAVKTSSPDFDNEWNVIIKLALIAIDRWTPAVSEIVKEALANPGISQMELAQRVQKTQSSVSEALSRANLPELQEMNLLYQKKIKTLIAPYESGIN